MTGSEQAASGNEDPRTDKWLQKAHHVPFLGITAGCLKLHSGSREGLSLISTRIVGFSIDIPAARAIV
jgi:hypothetical protein